MKATYPSAAVLPFPQAFTLCDEEVHDPYQACGTLLDPSVCSECTAVYIDGHWQWIPAPPGAHNIHCPACSRIRDKAAAGYVSIEGRFAREYHAELQLLVQTLEKRTASQHPMQRIMGIEDHPDRILVTTTDIHLARSIGEALHLAYKGNLDLHYNETRYLLRVRWQRWI